MINHFRTVLLNMNPVLANANPTMAEYMITDSSYTYLALSSLNMEIYNALFTGTTTDNEKVSRATTIHKIVQNSMLSPILTKYDSRITGNYSKAEVSPDVVTAIIEAAKTIIIDSTSPLFIGTTDKELYAEHAFFRQEPLENITGFAIAMVEDVIIKRNLAWL